MAKKFSGTAAVATLISLIKRELNLKADKNSVVTSVNGVTGDVTMGGRNLALDTAEEKVSTAKDAATMGVHWELSDYGKSVLNTVGTPVVLSYEAKADVEGQRVSVNLRVGTSSAAKHVTPYNQFVYPTTEYKRYTFSCQTLLEDPGRAWVLLGAAPDGQVGNVYVRNLYVGTGSAVQDWTPAPEDTQNALDAVNEKQNAHINNKDNPHGVTAAGIGAASRAAYTFTIPTSSWSQSGDYYFATVAVSGITADDNPEVIDIQRSADYAADDLMAEQLALVLSGTTSANQIKFRASGQPSVNLKLRMEVFR